MPGTPSPLPSSPLPTFSATLPTVSDVPSPLPTFLDTTCNTLHSIHLSLSSPFARPPHPHPPKGRGGGRDSGGGGFRGRDDVHTHQTSRDNQFTFLDPNRCVFRTSRLCTSRHKRCTLRCKRCNSRFYSSERHLCDSWRWKRYGRQMDLFRDLLQMDLFKAQSSH